MCHLQINSTAKSGLYSSPLSPHPLDVWSSQQLYSTVKKASLQNSTSCWAGVCEAASRLRLGSVPEEIANLVTVKVRTFDFGGASRPKGLDVKNSNKPIEVEVETGTNLEGLFKKYSWLGDPRDNSIMAFVNGQQKGLDYLLQQGDVLDFLTPMGGG